MEAMKNFLLRFPVELLQKLDDEARREKRSRNAQAQIIINQYYQQQESAHRRQS